MTDGFGALSRHAVATTTALSRSRSLSLTLAHANARELQKCIGIYSKESSAEDKRFELLKGFPLHAFQACALGRYANPPCSFGLQG